MRRGVERDEPAPDTDARLAAETLAGPLFARVLLTGAPLARGLARRIVDLTLDGARPRAAAPTGDAPRRASRARESPHTTGRPEGRPGQRLSRYPATIGRVSRSTRTPSLSASPSRRPCHVSVALENRLIRRQWSPHAERYAMIV